MQRLGIKVSKPTDWHARTSEVGLMPQATSEVSKRIMRQGDIHWDLSGLDAVQQLNLTIAIALVGRVVKTYPIWY